VKAATTATQRSATAVEAVSKEKKVIKANNQLFAKGVPGRIKPR